MSIIAAILFTEPLTFNTKSQEGVGDILPSATSDTRTPIETSHVTPKIEIKKFWIEIPQIDLIKDITLNVDPSDRDEYLDVIDQTVAHGKYTSLPYITGGNTYLFAHSMELEDGQIQPGGWFSRIDELKVGDKIVLGINDERYTYKVINSRIVDPLETSVYTGESSFDGSNTLTLQTCYPRGTTEQRLIVQAISE